MFRAPPGIWVIAVSGLIRSRKLCASLWPGSRYMLMGSPELATVERLARKGGVLRWARPACSARNPVHPQGSRGPNLPLPSLFYPSSHLSRAPSPLIPGDTPLGPADRIQGLSPLADVGAPGSWACQQLPGEAGS